MAERSPVYAELRNLIDLAIAAAYIQQQDYYDKAGWKMEFFGSEKEFPVETYDIPKTVESAVNAIWKGNTLMTPIGGGVTIQPTEALEADNLLADEKGKVVEAPRRHQAQPGQGPVVVGLSRCGFACQWPRFAEASMQSPTDAWQALRRRLFASTACVSHARTTRTSHTFVCVGPVLISAPSGSKK